MSGFQGGWYQGFARLRTDSTTGVARPSDWQEGFPTYLQGIFPRPAGDAAVETDTTGSISVTVTATYDSTASMSTALYGQFDSTANISVSLAGTLDSTSSASILVTSFHPNDIADAVWWLAADHIEGVGYGSEPTTWSDSLGVQNDAVSYGDPILQGNVINGLPSIYFDGNDRYDITNPTVFPDDQGFTLFVVTQPDVGNDSNNTIVSQSTKTFGDDWGLDVDSFWVYDGGLNHASYHDTTQWSFLTARHTDGGASRIRRDSTDWGVAGGLFDISPVAQSIGIGYASNITGSHFTGHIAEIIAYGRELLDSEVEQVEDYLIEKYGFTPRSTTYDSTGSVSVVTSATYDSTTSTSVSLEGTLDSTSSLSTVLETTFDSTGSVSVSVEGTYDSTASGSVHLWAQYDSTANLSVVLEATYDSTASLSAILALESDSTASSSAVLEGSYDSTASVSTHLQGLSDSTASLSLYLLSDQINDSTASISTILHGVVDSTASVSVTTVYEYDSTASVSALVQGTYDSTAATSIVLGGYSDSTASLSIYLGGASDSTSSVSITLSGTYDSTTGLSTVLEHTSDSTASASIKVISIVDSTASASIFLSGDADSTSSISIEVYGVGESTASITTKIILTGDTTAGCSIFLWPDRPLFHVYYDGLAAYVTKDGEPNPQVIEKSYSSSVTLSHFNAYSSIETYTATVEIVDRTKRRGCK